MIDGLVLADGLRAQIAREAAESFPRECCGLIEGILSGTMMHAVMLHPSANLASAPDRFEIDPRTHITLLRRLRGTAHGLIGCYHSHPNGQPAPSARDLDGANEEGFLWLIQAVQQGNSGELGAFVFTQNRFRPLCLVSCP